MRFLQQATIGESIVSPARCHKIVLVVSGGRNQCDRYAKVCGPMRFTRFCINGRNPDALITTLQPRMDYRVTKFLQRADKSIAIILTPDTIEFLAS